MESEEMKPGTAAVSQDDDGSSSEAVKNVLCVLLLNLSSVQI